MRLKTRKDEITPWQTFEEKTLMSASAFAPPVIKQKNSENYDRISYQSASKLQKPERKRLTTIESLIRLKTSNQTTSRQNISPIKNITTQKLRELIPLNGNLINIMNNVHEINRKMNSQTSKQKLSAKKLPKNILKNIKQQKQKFSLDSKVSLEKRKQQIQNLKRSLFYKLNPSFDILVKVKQRLTHINEVLPQPILRSYSIHNIRLNAIEQKDITKVISTGRTNKNRLKYYLNSTGQNFRPKSEMRNQVTKKRIISSVGKKENGHIIDRLYDRFQ